MNLLYAAIFLGLVASCALMIEETPIESSPIIDSGSDSILVAAWNLQVFGDTKASREETMLFYDQKLSEYDLIFVQEIRDKDGSAFEELCLLFEEYACQISSRDGRTISQEQIGIIYREPVIITNVQRMEDPADIWERSPVVATINYEGYEFTAVSAHLKPDDVSAEMDLMEDYVSQMSGEILIIGDLNADCDYYNPLFESHFSDWDWLISDFDDTTVSQTDCAYDRIIVNEAMTDNVLNSGIDSSGIVKEHSDHYIVWVELSE